MVEGFGEEGEKFFNEVTGEDLPEDLSESEHSRELARRLSESFSKPTFGVACYLLSSRWSLLGILRDAGATRDTFEKVYGETWTRLHGLVGEKKTQRAWEMTTEFMEAVGR